MQRSSIIIAMLLFAGCKDASPTGGNAAAAKPDANSAEAHSAAVTDFKNPELAGLAVRDHPQGVQVVSPPDARGNTPPPIGSNDLLWSLSEGAIFTSVNDVPARDARHFRELMDALEPGAEVRLGSVLFMEDVGDGQVILRTSPPDGQ